MRTVYINGQFVAEDAAHVSIFDRGLLFADAVYEVFSVLDGRVIDYAAHMMRLERSLAEMTIDYDCSAADWPGIVATLIERNALTEGTIYLQISRGAADRDFLFPKPGTPATVFAFTQARALVANPLAERGMRIITRPDRRWGRRDIKTVQLLYASMMKMEAKAAGVDDVWLVEGDVVTEGTSQNACIITPNGLLVTRDLGHHILPGVTRLSLIDIARASGITVEERPFTIAEAQGAAEAFVTSASLFVMPVVEIDGLRIGDGRPGMETMALRKAYIDHARAQG
ncbi:MAG: D-amino acid aminotransferase [Sphingomonadales bacterium RIFCSPHIGHO2_01_FULL_65_20]|uniref:D-amino-acid transaminase n=1 Tax=unclassified Blastomonas TaxID=2626550 RepID=UPI000835E0B5|nr:D-amino-acid transaminase [Blastomonas sp.]OHC94671.1 MAG: D-amino acid aminotransferase [Sphingomonadales bacterium RIFCSPHIGHO2_01_FULL_65_20]